MNRRCIYYTFISASWIYVRFICSIVIKFVYLFLTHFFWTYRYLSEATGKGVEGSGFETWKESFGWTYPMQKELMERSTNQKYETDDFVQFMMIMLREEYE
jgi:hypothetical protein